MDEKLVTLCILTFEKAQVLHSLLENEGIESYIHNVNLLQPTISAGVRVRIAEQDLPLAISVLDKTNFLGDPQPRMRFTHKELQKNPRFLVPIDFTDHSLAAAEYAIQKASVVSAEVRLLHVYYVPIVAGVLPLEMAFGSAPTDEELTSGIFETAVKKMEVLVEKLKKKMLEGELPLVPLSSEVQEGIPEDEILSSAKTYQPAQIFMGSHSGGTRHTDLLGSVSEEVIDRSPFPVLVIPQGAKLVNPKEVKRIAFISNFSQKDLIALDTYLRYNKLYNYELHLLTPYYSDDELAGIMYQDLITYFKKHYPNLLVTFKPIEGKDLYNNIGKYVEQQGIDLMAVTAHKRNLFSRLFYPGLAGEMLFYAKTPLLALK